MVFIQEHSHLKHFRNSKLEKDTHQFAFFQIIRKNDGFRFEELQGHVDNFFCFANPMIWQDLFCQNPFEALVSGGAPIKQFPDLTLDFLAKGWSFLWKPPPPPPPEKTLDSLFTRQRNQTVRPPMPVHSCFSFTSLILQHFQCKKRK